MTIEDAPAMSRDDPVLRPRPERKRDESKGGQSTRRSSPTT
jgi:hypothetical protein